MPSREPVPSVSTERTTVAQEDGKAPPTTAKFLVRSYAKLIGRHIILKELMSLWQPGFRTCLSWRTPVWTIGQNTRPRAVTGIRTDTECVVTAVERERVHGPDMATHACARPPPATQPEPKVRAQP